MGRYGGRKVRLNISGNVKVPSSAIAYFFNRFKSLTFIYPKSGEHPDSTIRRVLKQSGVSPSPTSVRTTDKYWEIVKSLPSSVVDSKTPEKE